MERISRLRDKMAKEHIDMVIIPHVDPHQSEYMADHWHLREFFSGFNGSAGTFVAGMDHALLWTDSRYFLQAAKQLEGTGIELMKEMLPSTPSVNEYITGCLRPGQTVGIDGMLFSVKAYESLKESLESNGIKLVADFKPADGIWLDRPPLPADKVFIHEEHFAGQPCTEKIKEILDKVRAEGAQATVVCALDAIAWTLNLRGSDVKYNPVFTSFLYLADEGSTLFIDANKLSPEVEAYLKANGIATAPYESIGEFLSALPADLKVLIDPASSSSSLQTYLGDRCVLGTSPVALLKGVKNPVQIQGMINAHVRDGVALVKAFMEIQRKVSVNEPLTEIGVAEILTKYRSQQPYYFDDSFGTICGYRGHGAIVHYEADAESDASLHPEGLLLIDSGAQYLDGTTDITRTIALGTPTDDERHDFTLVLKGHIALASAVFPEGTRGSQLDILAHQYLWKEGKTYLHGTGHGIGHFLNVHEGPQSIRLNDVPATLTPGMLTSNEPGIYRAGIHGIRCENLVLTVEAFTSEFGRFFRFETMTLFPFDRTLFDTAIMTPEEINWVNGYHEQVYSRLSPLLTPSQQQWLREKTLPL